MLNTQAYVRPLPSCEGKSSGVTCRALADAAMGGCSGPSPKVMISPRCKGCLGSMKTSALEAVSKFLAKGLYPSKAGNRQTFVCFL